MTGWQKYGLVCLVLGVGLIALGMGLSVNLMTAAGISIGACGSPIFLIEMFGQKNRRR